jgi:hypothetical protein
MTLKFSILHFIIPNLLPFYILHFFWELNTTIATKKKHNMKNHIFEHEIEFIFFIFHLNEYVILYISLNKVV